MSSNNNLIQLFHHHCNLCYFRALYPDCEDHHSIHHPLFLELILKAARGEPLNAEAITHKIVNYSTEFIKDEPKNTPTTLM